jgi:AcrR family transcriptional regulator
VPTGVAIRDAREQLFDAAERVLLREGPSGLTSRAVTTEAGCAKGVLHRHFPDFDDFLAELVLNRIELIELQGAALRNCAGTRTVVVNVTRALRSLFDSVAVAIVGLVIFRDDLRVRLREKNQTGVPLLTDAADMIGSYLFAERELGRVTAEAKIDTLAPTLIGAVHLLFAGREADPVDDEAIARVVNTVIEGVLR